MTALAQGRPVPSEPFGSVPDQHGMPGNRQACTGADPPIITTAVVTAAIAAITAMAAARRSRTFLFPLSECCPFLRVVACSCVFIVASWLRLFHLRASAIAVPNWGKPKGAEI